MLSQLNRRVQPQELAQPRARLLAGAGSRCRSAPRSVPPAPPRLPGLRELLEPQIYVGKRPPGLGWDPVSKERSCGP